MRPLGRGREIAPGSTVIEHLHRSAGLDVYDAYNEPRGCRVIVKTLRPDRLGKPSARAALMREGRLLKRLSHPHLVRAYEVWDRARPAIVLETLGGATLDHMIDTARRGAGSADIAELGLQLGSALGYLHSHGVLHLDLKPSNAIAEHGRVKLIDLSHARRPGRMRGGNGTWSFMAPEQVRDGVVGPAADVWGLGLLLYAVAARSTNPFGAVADELGTDEPQLDGLLAPIARVRPRLDRRLAELIDGCLEPAGADRPTLPELTARLHELAPS